MGVVTGLTADRMLAIEAGSVVDGAVDLSGHLILTKHDSTTIDAGNVVGPAGADGTDGVDGVNAIAEPGMMMIWATPTPPTGWLICDGAAISRTTYAALFALFGTFFGPGDGTTTFNLPNTKGRIPVGLDSSQTEFDTLGETGGEKTHTLTQAEIPKHQHGTTNPGWNPSYTGGFSNTGWWTSGDKIFALDQPAYEQATGDGPHNNLQPYIVLNFIVKT